MMTVRQASGFLIRRSIPLTRTALLSTTPAPHEATETIRRKAEAEMQKLVAHYEDFRNPPMLWSSREEASTFLRDNIDAALFDCDGVLYRSPDPAPGANECIQGLMDQGKTVLFVTNNAGMSRGEMAEKLTTILGVNGLKNEQMIASSYSAAQFLRQQLTGKRVHVIGSEGLCQELKQTGFQITGGPSSEKASMDREELANYGFPEHPVDAIVVGHDTDFNFRKLSIANVLLQRNPDALLVATNRDQFDLVGADGRHIPGNGSLVAALEYCSRRTATNVGKPSQTLTDLIQTEHKMNLKRTLFVGDRLDTDIRFGADTGMLSALVMTGVTTAEYMIKLGSGTEDEPLPSAILAHVGLLI